MNTKKLDEILKVLADLSVNGESNKICLYALKLQVALAKYEIIKSK